MARYDYDDFRMRPMPPSYGWYPGAFWAGGPVYGWDPFGGAWGWAPYVAPVYPGYARDYAPRRPPRESPTYGRGGDRALQHWARRHGYDVGYRIDPRPPRRYDRDW